MRTFIGIVNGMTDASAEYEVAPAMTKVAEDMVNEFGRDGTNSVQFYEDDGTYNPKNPIYHFKVARSTTVHTAVVEGE